MLIDSTDIKIICILYNLKKGEEISTKYDLVKKIFPVKSEYERKKEYTRIKRKLKKLSDYGLIKERIKSDKIERELQVQNIDFRNFRFKDGKKRVICLKINFSWSAFELS